MVLSVRLDGVEVPVRALRIDRRLAHPVGMAELHLAPGIPPPAPGTVVALEARIQDGALEARTRDGVPEARIRDGVLEARTRDGVLEARTRDGALGVRGAGGDGVLLMTGHVARTEGGAGGVRVDVLEPLAAALRPMAAERFARTTGGAVIEALLSRCGVPLGVVLPGHAVPSAVLGPGGQVLDHAMRMAALGGLALAGGADGRVSTVALGLAVPGGALRPDRAARHLGAVVTGVEGGAVRVVGAGAMGARGPQAATLPLADPGAMTDGPADAAHTHRAAGVRTLADAANLRRALEARARAGAGGLRLVTPLPEDLSPGDVVALPGGPARLERVAITLSAAAGLVACYVFSGAAAAATPDRVPA